MISGLFLAGAGGVDAEDDFRRGDASADGRIDLADVLRIAHSLLPGAEALPCPDAADIDDDGAVLPADATLLALYLYAGAAPPPSPFEACGPDPSLDLLPGCTYGAALCAQQVARQPSPDFELRFVGNPERTTGSPGERLRLGSIAVGLCSGDGGAQDQAFAVEAWSLSVGATDCLISSATTEGTAGAEAGADPAGRRSGGFEKTEVVTSGLNALDAGAVSAVILSFSLPVRLEERGVGPGCEHHELLRLDLEADIPPAGVVKRCSLAFVDGLRGSGQPVPNLVNTVRGGFKPAAFSREIEVGAAVLKAAIRAPPRVLLLAKAVTVPLDGSSSTDGRGGSALLYDWKVIQPPLVPPAEVARRRDSRTAVTFFAPGAYIVELAVLGGDQFDLQAVARMTVSVVLPRDIEASAPSFAVPDQELPTALSARSYKAAFPLASGNPAPTFRLAGSAPAGLAVERDGSLNWNPSLEQVGGNAVVLQAVNALGQANLNLVIDVADEKESVAFFGAAAAAEAGAGGGASLQSAPETLADGSTVKPELLLHLEIASQSKESSVQLVLPDDPGQGDDRFAGLRFSPDPGDRVDGEGPFGGVYRSGASASKFTQQVLAGGGSFTVEVWVSQVPDRQVGGVPDSPAVIAALLSRDGGETSWLFAKENRGRTFSE